MIVVAEEILARFRERECFDTWKPLGRHCECSACVAYYAQLDACPLRMSGADADDSCPDDPDGLHHIGCGCDRDEE